MSILDSLKCAKHQLGTAVLKLQSFHHQNHQHLQTQKPKVNPAQIPAQSSFQQQEPQISQIPSPKQLRTKPPPTAAWGWTLVTGPDSRPWHRPVRQVSCAKPMACWSWSSNAPTIRWMCRWSWPSSSSAETRYGSDHGELGQAGKHR